MAFAPYVRFCFHLKEFPMSPTARNRVNDLTSTEGGSLQTPQGFYPVVATVGSYVNTTDIVGNFGGNNTFNLLRTFRDMIFLNGTWPIGSSSPTWIATNYRLSVSNGAPDTLTMLGEPSSLQLASWYTMLAAETNPSAAHVSLPTLAGEASGYRELGNSVRDFGRATIAAKAGSAYLTYRWVIKPLVSDVRNMIEFSSAVEKRLRELENIRKNGGSSKRATLLTETLHEQSSQIVESHADPIYADVKTTYSRRVWGTTHWVPLYSGYIPDGREDLRRKTENVLAGMSKDGLSAAAWELLPWSWLIDWFSNVGALLAARQNSFGLEQKNTCIMVHDRVAKKFTLKRTGVWTTWLTPTSDTFTLSSERKRRYPISDLAPYIPPFSPLMRGKHLSILAALLASRQKRS